MWVVGWFSLRTSVRGLLPCSSMLPVPVRMYISRPINPLPTYEQVYDMSMWSFHRPIGLIGGIDVLNVILGFIL